MSRLIDLTGKRFGRLIVIKQTEDYVSPAGKHLKQWECRCDCGNTCIATGCNLKAGRQTSCGCGRAEKLKNIATKHGMAKTSIHNKWMGIIQRCEDVNNRNYPRWGGRGIKICKRWRDSFEAFYEDVSKLEHYGEDGYTLDRYPDLNGNYEPGNVRWATAKQQANNTRSNVCLTYKGETHTVAEWADIVAIPYFTLMQRINELGWSVEKALETPSRGRFHFIEYNGCKKSIKEWAEELKMPAKVLDNRIYNGMPVEKAFTLPYKECKKRRPPDGSAL